MEPQQQQHPNEDRQISSTRQNSTRWTPTTEQIRILKELYYNNGVRSPSADQIQRISARLRQYGKIEGKNVFYWFQNHKARERQKKRFTTPTTADHHVPIPMQQQQQRPNINNTSSTVVANAGGCTWKSDASHLHNNNNNNNYPNITHGYAPSTHSSTGGLTVGQDYSISAYGSGSTGAGATESLSHNNFGWVGSTIDHPAAAAYSSSYTFFDKKKFIDGILQEEEEQEDYDDGYGYGDYDDEEEGAAAPVHVAPHIETLPLFPMHGGDINYNAFCNNLKPEELNRNSYFSGSNWYRSDDHAYNNYNGSRRASLELSLNSYTAGSHDFI